MTNTSVGVSNVRFLKLKSSSRFYPDRGSHWYQCLQYCFWQWFLNTSKNSCWELLDCVAQLPKKRALLKFYMSFACLPFVILVTKSVLNFCPFTLSSSPPLRPHVQNVGLSCHRFLADAKLIKHGHSLVSAYFDIYILKHPILYTSLTLKRGTKATMVHDTCCMPFIT